MVIRIFVLVLPAISVFVGCGEPARLQVVADIPGLYPLDVQAEGEFLYIADASEGLVIADISDPLQPRVIASLLPSNSRGGVALRVSHGHAYLSTGYEISEGYMFAIDVSDPLRPVETAQIRDHMYDFVITGDLLYAVNGEFAIYDLSVPSSPSKISEPYIQAPLQFIAVWEDLVFLGGWFAGVTIVDASDLVAPVIIGHHAESRVFGLAAADGLLYMATGEGLSILDVADPAQPRLRGSAAGTCEQVRHSLSVVGRRAHVSGDGCVNIYDISNPDSPELIALLDAPVRTDYWAITAHEGYTYVAQPGRVLVLSTEQ
jgi:hypothetical protein